MTTFYVATLARYVLVEAETETQAREAGRRALSEQYADVPIDICTVRPATAEELELKKWHNEMVGRERNHRSR